MLVLKQLVDAGKVTPEIDRTYSLSEAAAAFAYVEAGHTRGKVVITMKTAGVSPQAVWSGLYGSGAAKQYRLKRVTAASESARRL